MPLDDETDRRKVMRFRLTALQIVDLCAAPPDSEIVQATYNKETERFEFTLRNDRWPSIPEGQDIPFGRDSENSGSGSLERDG